MQTKKVTKPVAGNNAEAKVSSNTSSAPKKDWRREAKRLLKENETLKADNEELKKAIVELQKENTELKAELDEWPAKIAAIRRDCNVQIEQEEAKTANQEFINRGLQNNLKNKNLEIQMLKSEIAELKKSARRGLFARLFKSND